MLQRPAVLAVVVLGALLSLSACKLSNDSPDGGTGGGCTKASQCSNGFVCSVGSCGAPHSRDVGDPCSASRDCKNGFYCSLEEKCAAAGSGGEGATCANDAQCGSGLRCDIVGLNGYCHNAGGADLGEACTKNLDCLDGLFCGSDAECHPYAEASALVNQPFPGVACPADTGPFKSYFQVPRVGQALADFYRLPYPNDIRVTAQGKLSIADFPKPGPTVFGPDLVALYVDALTADFDGFSAQAPVAFRFSKDLDFGFFDGHALDAVHTLDLTAKTEFLSRYYYYSGDAGKFNCQNYLTVSPQGYEMPFEAKHTYMLVLLKSGVKATAGDAPVQDDDLVTILGATKPAGDELGRAWDLYAPLRKYVSDNHLATTDIVNASIFTVGDSTGHMARLAVAAAAQPPPALSALYQCGTGGADPCDDGTDASRKCGNDAAFVEVHGKIKMALFQNGTPPYAKPADGGKLNETGNAVTKVGDQDVCFALTLPKKSMPGAGWPLMVYSHGTGGNYRSFIGDGVAGAMAGAGTPAAVFSFDSVWHGPRRGTSTQTPDVLVFNVLNPPAARDNFLQGAADIITALQVPKSAVPGTWSGPTIKFAGKAVFFGHSQGATHGELMLPFNDDAPAAILSGAGANLALGLANKTQPVDTAAALTFLLSDPVNENHPVVLLWQNYFDRSDPGVYDRLIVSNPPNGHASKHVFMSWGVGDSYAPRKTQDFNATCLGVPIVGQILEDGGFYHPSPAITRPVLLDLPVAAGRVTAGLFQYMPAGYDGHFVATMNPAAVKDWTAFASLFFATGTPTIP